MDLSEAVPRRLHLIPQFMNSKFSIHSNFVRNPVKPSNLLINLRIDLSPPNIPPKPLAVGLLPRYDYTGRRNNSPLPASGGSSPGALQ